MIKKYSFIKFMFILSLFFIFVEKSLAAGGEDATKESVNKAIEVFCQSEFQHNISNRYDLIKMSSAYQDRLEKLTGTSIGTLYIPDAYEVFAVKSYKILDVNVEGNKAIATVSYDVLAKRIGWKHHEYKDGTAYGEAIFTEYIKPNYVEKINLVFENNRWLILDPPFPKISADKVIAFYEQELDWFKTKAPKGWNSIVHLQNSYNEKKRNLDLLKMVKEH